MLVVHADHLVGSLTEDLDARRSTISQTLLAFILVGSIGILLANQAELGLGGHNVASF